jgi:hypothetical protein
LTALRKAALYIDERATQQQKNVIGMEWNNSGKNGFYCKFKYSP